MKKRTIKILIVFCIGLSILLVLLGFLFFQEKSKNDATKRENDSLQVQIDALQKTKRSEPIFKKVEAVEPKEYIIEDVPLNKEYIGRWKRAAFFIDGEQERFSDAILEITDGSFVKTTDCIISGTISVSENKMIMSVKNDECNEGKNNFVSSYKISSDRNTLTLSISDSQFEVIEEYERILTSVPQTSKE